MSKGDDVWCVKIPALARDQHSELISLLQEDEVFDTYGDCGELQSNVEVEACRRIEELYGVGVRFLKCLT